MTGHARAPAWIALAAAVHAVVLAALLILPMPIPHRPDLAPHGAEPTEIAIMLEGESRPAEPPPNAAADPPTAGAASLVAARSAARGASSAAGVSSGEPMSAARTGEAPPSGAPAAAGSGGVVAVPFTAAELGIGGPNPFLPRAEEKAPTGREHRAMRGTGLEHDRGIGLGPEGPVVRALADATSASIAPLRGRAVFIVRSGGDGMVLGIDVVDSEGGSGWSDAGRIALESLRGKRLVVPRGANGMNMRIEVRSDMKLPNGEDAPIGVRSGENKMPEMTIPDVSNIGARPRRVVHSRVVSTELL